MRFRYADVFLFPELRFIVALWSTVDECVEWVGESVLVVVRVLWATCLVVEKPLALLKLLRTGEMLQMLILLQSLLQFHNLQKPLSRFQLASRVIIQTTTSGLMDRTVGTSSRKDLQPKFMLLPAVDHLLITFLAVAANDLFAFTES